MHDLKKISKHMRQKPTRCERVFREKLIAWGIRFRFQYVIGPYIADFYLPQYKMVVEIDGASHFTRGGRLHDMNRTARLENLGYSVMRVQNELVYKITKELLFSGVDELMTLPVQDEQHEFNAAYFASL